MRITHPKEYLRHIPFVVALAIVSLIFADNAPSKRPEAGVWTQIEPAAEPPDAGFLMGKGKGEEATLRDYRGKVVLLNIWATWCTPCLKELPYLHELQETYVDKGLVVLALSVDTNVGLEQVRLFLGTRDLEIAHLALDGNGVWEQALNLRGLPVSYIIDREGRMTHRYIGAANWMDATKKAPILKALSAPAS
jgi:thiol-disulfide isomerase/thioredoxin